MTNEYINHVKHRKNKNEYKNICFFGYGFGTFISLLFSLKYFMNVDNLYYDKFYIMGIICGEVILILTVFSPFILKYPQKIVNGFINILFYILFDLLLTIIYLICITPIGLLLRLKKKKDSYKITNFVDKKNILDPNLTISYNKFYQLCQIIQIFLKGGYFLLLPSIIIIIITGLLFLFLQSNVVAPFIYSLF